MALPCFATRASSGSWFGIVLGKISIWPSAMALDIVVALVLQVSV